MATATKPPISSPLDLVSNPVISLLPEDRVKLLGSLSAPQRQLFYGRVLESVFSNPAYQKVVFETAAKEFDKLAGASTGSGMQTAIETAVRKVLAERGIK